MMTAAADDPITTPLAWSTVYLAGVPSPGVATVTGWSRDYDWDVKKPGGGQGAKETYNGRPPATGKVRITIGFASQTSKDTTGDIAAQFAALRAWCSLLAIDGTKGKPIMGVDIRHPALMALHPPVTSVILQKEGQLERILDGDSLHEITLELMEATADPITDATATASGTVQSAGNPPAGNNDNSGGGPGSATDDPVGDANEAEIQQLLDQASQPDKAVNKIGGAF
jgi:hypothetical protein